MSASDSREAPDVLSGEKKKRRTVKMEKVVNDVASVSTPDPTPPMKSKSQTALESKQANRALFYYEENEVSQRDPYEDLELHKGVCNELRQVMARIKELKDSGRDNVADEIEALRIHGTLQFVSLKKLNRIGHFRCKKVREVTNEAKQKIDQHHLRLQNLLYEVMHLQKEITKCLQFKSKDEEISLISIDDFYATAPKEISKPSLTHGDNHQLTLARLDFEMEQRKCLSEKLKEMQVQKDHILAEIKAQKDYLDSLQPKLKNIIQTTKPVQDYLAMPFDDVKEQHQTAQFLPEPLYVLYMQAKAYSESCDKYLSVGISGDVEAIDSIDDSALDLDEDSDSEEEQDKANGKRHRRSTVDNQLARKQERILKKHPLSVCLVITCKDKSVLSLTFCYLVSLKIATVSVKLTPGPDTQLTTITGGDLLNPEIVLSCLYPDDSGDRSPNPATSFSLQHIGMGKLSDYVGQVGHPYLWVQWLCGLQFFVESQTLQKSQAPLQTSQIEETMKRLRSRIQTRLALQKQMSALEHGNVPITSGFIGQFPAKIVSRLVEWRRMTYEDYLVCPYTQRIIACELTSPNHFYFSGLIDRGTAALTFQVVLAPDYPSSLPVFALSLRWNNEHTALNDEGVREMEKEVNMFSRELVGGKADDQLLTVQLQCLLMCLDVYLETEMDRPGIEGPNEFAKEKSCLRTTRGPSRCKPYKYHHQLGFFSQR